MLYRNFLIVLCLLYAKTVVAGPGVNLEINDGDNSHTVVNQGGGLDDVEAGDSLTVGSAVASAYANISSGKLQANVVSPTAVPGNDYRSYNSSAQSILYDDVYFYPDGATGTSYLDYHWEGTMSPSSGNIGSPNATAFFQINVIFGAESPPSFQKTFALTDVANGCASIVATTCKEGTSISETGSIEIPIQRTDVIFYIALSARAEDGAFADFANNSSVYLRLPSGVTVRPVMGQGEHFLDTAAPIAMIPEPSTNALLIGGIGIIALVKRRQRHQPVSQTA